MFVKLGIHFTGERKNYAFNHPKFYYAPASKTPFRVDEDFLIEDRGRELEHE